VISVLSCKTNRITAPDFTQLFSDQPLREVHSTGVALDCYHNGLELGITIFPCAPLASKEVADAQRAKSEVSIKVLNSNVLMENRRVGDLLALVRE
jgi:hypothetical protein